MGLFKKRKQRPNVVQVPQGVVNQYPTQSKEEVDAILAEYSKRTQIRVNVNLTEKNVKVPLDQDGRIFVKGLYLWEEEGLIKGLNGDKVIFEITKRSKAYNELLPHARKKTKHCEITQRDGAYGKYYYAKLVFEELKE